MPQAAASHSLTFKIERKGSTALVHCHGRLYAGVCNDLYNARSIHSSPTHKRIILDLTDLTSVDSMGLGTLVRLYVSAKSGAPASSSSILASRSASSWGSRIFFRSSAICAKKASL